VVVEVARSQPVRLTEPALAVGIAQGTASPLVDALVRGGLRERRTSANDRRSVRLRVTPQGAAPAQDWTSGYEAAEELFRPLGSGQMSTLVDILRIPRPGSRRKRAADATGGSDPRWQRPTSGGAAQKLLK